MNYKHPAGIGLATIACATLSCAALLAPTANAAPAEAPAKAAPAAPAAAAPAAAPATPEAPVVLPPRPADGVAAVVNGDKISMDEVDRFMARVKKQSPSLGDNSNDAKRAIINLQERILESLITHRVLFQEAHRQKLDVPKENVDKALEEMRGQFKDDAEMTQNLKDEGLTLAEVREQIGELMAIDKLGESWTRDLLVQDDEILKFYNTNIEKFKVPEQVHARHILLQVKKEATPAERTKVKNKALALLKQSQQKGVDFAKLATATSEDEGSKPHGGDLGSFPRGMMVPSFEKAAFGTPAGKITPQLVESEFGYHIIKVEEKVAGHNVPLVEVKDRIKAYLMKKKSDERINGKIEALRSQAKIKKNF